MAVAATGKLVAVMIMALEVAGVLAIVAVVVGLMRQSRHRGDSVGRFSRAVSALRDIADHPSDLSVPEREPSAPPRLTLVAGGATRSRPRRTNCERPLRVAKPSAETVSRRPVIAHLPAVSARPGDAADEPR